MASRRAEEQRECMGSQMRGARGVEVCLKPRFELAWCYSGAEDKKIEVDLISTRG